MADLTTAAETVTDYIVLPDDVDLNTCDREALHVPGGVQAHGVLLAVDRADSTVVIASANAGTVMGLDGDLLGRPVTDLVSSVREPGLDVALRRPGHNRLLQRVTTHDGRPFDAIVHGMQGLTIVELEPHDPDHDPERLLSLVTIAGEEFMGAQRLADAQQRAAVAVRRLTGFDRVMVYMFHPDDHGEVVAEDRRADLDSFKGLHYPATDIPKQARVLYTRNWTRLLVDSQAEPSPLVPGTVPGSDEPLNLALAQLRSVSPIHREYLRNMGVRTSLSLSLVHDGRLVGLVACHHHTPRHVPFAVRASCELLARLLSEQLARAAADQHRQEDLERQQVQVSALRHVAQSGTPERALKTLAGETIALLEASSFVGRVGDAMHRYGPVPVPDERIEALLLAHAGAPVIAQERLGREGDEEAGGVLLVRLDDADHSFLAWFRPPLTRTVTWGGNPEEGVSSGGEKLTPRASFAAWSQTIQGTCLPWQARDIALVKALGSALARTTAADDDADDVSSVIGALTDYARDLERTNAELRRATKEQEEMVSAVAHDLRGPLRTMSGFVGVLRDHLTDEDPIVTDLSARISTGAAQMAQLLDGLQHWGRLGNVITPAPVTLADTVDTVLEGLRRLLDETGATVEVGPLPTVEGDPVLLRELLQNLVENAVKYRHPDRRPLVSITSEQTDSTVVVSVRDNGVGIDPGAVEDVFRMFHRVRPGHDEGIGLGLALVARITERHGGSVWAESIPGHGSTFNVKLPLRGAA